MKFLRALRSLWRPEPRVSSQWLRDQVRQERPDVPEALGTSKKPQALEMGGDDGISRPGFVRPVGQR